MDSKTLKAIIFLSAISLMLGFTGVFTRKLGEFGLDSIDIAFVKGVTTVVLMFPLMLFLYRNDLRPRLKDLPLLLMLGVARFAIDITLFYSQNNISLALASLLQMTFPYYVMVISLIVFKQKITLKKLAAAFIGFIGAIIITGVIFGKMDIEVSGMAAALLSGLILGLYIVGGAAGTQREIEPMTMVFYAYLVCAILGIPFTDFDAVTSAAIDVEGLLYIVGLGLLLTIIPEYVTIWSTKFLDATTVSIICVLELVAAVFAGIIFFSENLTLKDMIGVSLVILSIIVLNVSIKKTFGKYVEVIEDKAGLIGVEVLNDVIRLTKFLNYHKYTSALMDLLIPQDNNGKK